jgi:hypothetical protein
MSEFFSGVFLGSFGVCVVLALLYSRMLNKRNQRYEITCKVWSVLNGNFQRLLDATNRSAQVSHERALLLAFKDAVGKTACQLHRASASDFLEYFASTADSVLGEVRDTRAIPVTAIYTIKDAG